MNKSTVGLCVSVVFGTAATYLRQSNRMIMTGSAVSIVAFLSIRGLLSTRRTKSTHLSPLEHLKVLNNEPRSISSISFNIPVNNVHRRL